MASRKEAHLFDAPGYSSAWTPAEIDERYRPFFEHEAGARVRGEATPIYLFLPEVARELARYNPDLKVIVLLRDPVERAISHYYMEKGREREHLPLWLALLREPFRVRRCRDARAFRSAVRTHSYRSRGLYSRQLRKLYRHFEAGSGARPASARDLRKRHDATLRRVFARDLAYVLQGGIEVDLIIRRTHRVFSGSLLSGAVDRLVRCPVGLASRLITWMGRSDFTTRRHLPVPTPSAPARSRRSSPLASSDSSSRALTMRAPCAGTGKRTAVPGDSPLPSMPSMLTSAASGPRLMTRRRLTWLTLRPGLKMATWCPVSVWGTTSCTLVTKPSSVRR